VTILATFCTTTIYSQISPVLSKLVGVKQQELAVEWLIVIIERTGTFNTGGTEVTG
jgi:hypothetical protein